MSKYSTYNDNKLFEMLCWDKPYSEKAFAELYARYSQRVYAYCVRLIGNTNDAADVFQETFMHFFDEGVKEKEINKVPAFLFKIAHNFAINLQIGKRSVIELKDYHILAHDSAFEEKELMDIMAKALAAIESELRESFILRVYQGMEYEEIAELLEATPAAVRNRVWRAKEKIKAIYNTYMQDV